MRAIFIQHGQSTGNAGIPCEDTDLMELTDLGRQQSRELAADWTETPDLIVISPLLRTQQTATATMERFSGIPVEVWPIEEFTYLQPSRWTMTLRSQRIPHVEHIWSENDPEFCDGERAESFSILLEKAGMTLDRLAFHPDAALVYVFCHGQFIQAVRSLVVDVDLSDRKKMRKFWGKDSPIIQDIQRVVLRFEGGGWRCCEPE